jgi:hypothetical protein
MERTMSHANPPEHGMTSHAAAHSGHPLFPPAEMQAFEAADRKAGTYIVGLLTSIFILAIIGYIFVCLWIAK